MTLTIGRDSDPEKHRSFSTSGVKTQVKIERPSRSNGASSQTKPQRATRWLHITQEYKSLDNYSSAPSPPLNSAPSVIAPATNSRPMQSVKDRDSRFRITNDVYLVHSKRENKRKCHESLIRKRRRWARLLFSEYRLIRTQILCCYNAEWNIEWVRGKDSDFSQTF